MLKIGVTGGIGSGKTTVCQLFESLGVKVYYADQRSKLLVQHDQNIIRAISMEFGDEFYNRENVLDRKRLASIVFRNKLALEKLNQIIHPAVNQDFSDWCQLHLNEKYVIKEAALLFESGSYINLDKIVLVYAPMKIRIKRIMERDGIARSEVICRINNQLSDEEKRNKSDYIIFSYGRYKLRDQIEKLHEIFTLQANS